MENETTSYNLDDVKTVKHYKKGDTISFYKAMSYLSLFVGTTHYLIGRDTLDNGIPIEFECFSTTFSVP